MQDHELISYIKAHLNNCYAYGSDEITERRQKAIDYFFLRPILKEEQHRSRFRTSDVFDVVTALLPPLLKIFLGGERVGMFKPFGPNDVETAEMISDYVEYLVTRKHNSFKLFFSAFLDALLCGAGVWKYYWDTSETKTPEVYEGLGPDEVAFLMADEEFEIEEISDGEFGKTVRGLRIKRGGQLAIDVVPPEDFFVSKYARSMIAKEAPFVATRIRTTLSDLRRQGFDPDPIAVEYEMDVSTVMQARSPTGDLSSAPGMFSWMDEATRPVIVYEAYLDISSGKDIAEKRRVLFSGDQILVNEVTDDVPFAVITPYPIPHQPLGISVADVTCPIQELHTSLMRQILDNHYQMNFGRWLVVEGRVEVDDLLKPSIPQVIRCVGTTDAIRPVPTESISPTAFTLLEYVHTMRENRTGVTRYNQGMDAQSLNKTATGITAILQQSSQKAEMIARAFAETGVSELYKGVLSLVCKHQRKKELVLLREKWQVVDPTLWRHDRDLIVNVGLGITNRDAEVAKLMQLLQLQLQILGLPGEYGAMVGPENIRATVEKIVSVMGYKDVHTYLRSPEQAQAIASQQQMQQAILAQMQQAAQPLQPAGGRRRTLEQEDTGGPLEGGLPARPAGLAALE